VSEEVSEEVSEWQVEQQNSETLPEINVTRRQHNTSQQAPANNTKQANSVCPF
jgi:hypothetical protein